MSPERIAGRAGDPRDDVYGYGRILEDVLERLEDDAAEMDVWRRIAQICIGPDETRPADGRALLGVVASIGRG